MNKDQVVAALVKGVEEFIAKLQMWKSPKVIWCTAKDGETEWAKIYVRRSQRLINRKMTQCLDLGTIEIHEDLRGQGVLSAVLEALEELNPWGTVFIENVLDPKLADALRKRGYITDQSKPALEGSPACLYKQRETPRT